MDLSQFDYGHSFSIYGDIGRETSRSASHWLFYNKPSNPTIFLNTEGGNVAQALAIYDMIRLSGADVSIIVVGECFSAGLIILAAAKQERRYAMPHAEFMAHVVFQNAPNMSVRYELPRPKPHIIREMNALSGGASERAYDLQERALQVLVDRTSLSLQEAEELFAAQEYITANDALKLGIIGEVLSYGD